MNLGYPWAQCTQGDCSTITASLQPLPDGSEEVISDSHSVYNYGSLEAKLFLRHNGATDVNSSIVLKLSNETEERNIKLYNCGGDTNLVYTITLNLPTISL